MILEDIDPLASPPSYDSCSSAQPLSPGKLVHHDWYYLEEGNIVFRVEDVLFKVWDGPFRQHSDTFCKMYGLRTRSDLAGAAAAGVAVAGGHDTDAGALYLPNVTAVDFERLLWILIPPVIGQCKAHTIPDWSSILALATQWGFHTTRAVALRELEEFDIEPVRKIVLAQRCGISPRWAAGAYAALCTRAAPMRVEEAEALGARTAGKVAMVRERLLARGWGWGWASVERVVEEVFGLGPAGVDG